MTVIHVGCLPFPTYQGTQAALASMLQASSELFGDTRVITYAARAYDVDAPYSVVRIPDRPRVESLRSGPSVGKLVLDLRMVAQIRTLVAQTSPRAVMAHHIEAAVAALASGARPIYYVAHTALGPELPTYFHRALRRPVSFAGRALERWICKRASGVAAVAPTLARKLGPGCVYLPVPWRPKGPQVGSSLDAREAVGLPTHAPVLLYAGNLDRYQGWEDLVAALGVLRQSHREAVLLVATESDPTPLVAQAARAGLRQAVRTLKLDGEDARARAHGAADLAWVPRRTPGGLPVKLLDAFARGLPVVATERALAGLDVEAACLAVPDDDPAALAHGARALLSDRGRAARQVEAAQAYLSSRHDVETFGRAMCELTGEEPRPAKHARPLEPSARAPRWP